MILIPKVIFLILLCNTIQAQPSNFITQNLILTKKNRTGERGITQILPTSSFYEFLQSTGAYADKTLFVKFIMEDCGTSPTIITAPRRWGKSLLAKMLEFFLQTEIDDFGQIVPQPRTKSYRFFTAGRIENEHGLADDFNGSPLISALGEFIETNVAKFPVIVVDFTHLNGASTFIVFLKYFKTLLSKIFFKHTTAVKNLCLKGVNVYGKKVPRETCTGEDLRHFYNIHEEKNLTQFDLRFSLRFLSKLLASCYDSTVVLIIDEFDRILTIMLTIRKSMPESDKILVEQFYLNFLRISVIDNQYVHKAIVNGAYPILFDNATLSNVTYMRHLDAALYPYYGFTGYEVETILNHYNISPPAAHEVVAIYDGFQVHDSLHDKRVFNPSAIVKFIHYKNLDYYWVTDAPLPDEALRIAKNDEVMLKLRARQCLEYQPLKSIHLQDYLRLEGRAVEENRDRMKNLEEFLRILDIEGYLTIVHHRNSTHCVKLPNIEIIYKINLILFGVAIFYSYYHEPAAADAVARLLENTDTDVGALLLHYKNMLQYRYKEKYPKIEDKGIYHRFRFLDILHEATRLYNYSVDIGPLQNPVQPYLSIHKNSSALIVQIEYERNDGDLKSDILQRLWPRARRYFNDNLNADSLKLIVVNVRLVDDVKFVNYSFTSVHDIPEVENVTQFSANFLSI